MSDGDGVGGDAGDDQRQERGQRVGELDGKDDGGERRAERTGKHRAHADERQRAFRHVEQMRRQCAEGGTDHEQWREHATGSAGAEREGPHERFEDDDAEDEPERGAAREQGGDVVVADAEAVGKEQAADAHAEAADGGPPHPVHGQLAEHIFEAVHHAAHGGGGESDERAEHGCQNGEAYAAGNGVRREREERSGTEPEDAQHGGGDAGEGDGNQ